MKKTPLYNRHVELGAKLIDFHGWTMPVQYTSVIEEHRATRERAGLFDICHMGEIDVKGSSAFEFLQQVMSRNLEGQEIGQMKLSVMTTEEGALPCGDELGNGGERLPVDAESKRGKRLFRS
jgi:aminomethyltransferase